MKKTPQTNLDTQNINENNNKNSIDEQFDFTGVTIPQIIGNYKLLKSIGYGACSLVKLCQQISPTNFKNNSQSQKEKFFACKIIPKIRLTDERMKQSFESEVRIIQQLHHPGIVQLVDLLKDDNNYYVILEYCPNGDLFSYITNKGKIREPEAKYIFKQILEALKYLQSLNVSHRDLKPENILFGDNYCVKISDFGLSKFLLESKLFLVQTPCGSPCYASPECISGIPYNGKTTDVWSCGVILFTMLTGHLPWTKQREDQIFRQIKNAEYKCPKYISSGAKSLIKGLLTVDIYLRLTVDEALHDPWLSDAPPIINLDVNNFVSINKIDRFFDREISDESLIKTLKIRKRIRIEPVEVEKEKNTEKEDETKKKVSFFQRLKLKRAMKSDSKSKIKTKNITPNKKEENNSNTDIINSNPPNNNDLEVDYFCGLKRSLSLPTLNIKGIQNTKFNNSLRCKKLHSEESYNCNYINLM